MKMSRSESGKLGHRKSRITQHENYLKRLSEYMESPTRCRFCDRPLSYRERNKKFCNSSCSAKSNNCDVRRHGKEPPKCLNCEFKTKGTYYKYCSRECLKIYAWNKIKKEILDGSKSHSLDAIKRFLSETRGCCCEICKLSEWIGVKMPLVLDHIDGNHENNSLDNLRLLCNNCDAAFSPTYKARNRGKGRAARRLAREKYKKNYGFYV